MIQIKIAERKWRWHRACLGAAPRVRKAFFIDGHVYIGQDTMSRHHAARKWNCLVRLKISRLPRE